MIYSKDGCPLQGEPLAQTTTGPHITSSGITGGYGGDRRVEYIIPKEARAQGYHEFVIESSCNGMFGVPMSGDIIAPPDVCLFFIIL
jgi:alpha-mannosidase